MGGLRRRRLDQRLDPARAAAIAQSLYDDRSLLWSNLTVTAGEIVLGLALALVTGLVLAIALHRFRTVRGSVYPLLVEQTIPIPVIAPLLVFWLGFGLAPKVSIIALVCFFPIVVPTLDALDAIDAEQLKLMGTLGASSRQVFRFVEAPAALPGLFTGGRLAVAVAVSPRSWPRSPARRRDSGCSCSSLPASSRRRARTPLCSCCR